MKLHLPKPLFVAVMSVLAIAPATATITVNDEAKTVTVSGSYNRDISPDTADGVNSIAAKTNGTETTSVTVPDGYKLVIDTEAGNTTNNWLANSAHTYAGLLQIGDGVNDSTTGFILTNGNANTNMTFTGKVTGSGIFQKTSGGTGMKLNFTGDVTEYTGNMNLNASAAWTLTFGNGGTAPTTTAQAGASGTGTITFNSGNNDLVYNYGSAEAPVYLTNAIVKGANGTAKVTLKGGASYNLLKNATIDVLTFADGSTLTVGGGNTLNITGGTSEIIPSGNGFTTIQYNVGNNISLADTATLKLNGLTATISDGVASATGTTYCVQESAEFNKASMSSYTGATAFLINNGATLSITETADEGNGIIYGAVTVKTGGVLQLEKKDAMGWQNNNVKTLLVEDGAEVKLTHDNNETFGGVLTLQGNAKISGANARWDMFTNSSATIAANANATLDIKELKLRRNDTTFSLGNSATLTINANITNAAADNEGNGKLIITANNGSGSVVNLNGGADLVGLQVGGVTANINEDMTLGQLMLSKNSALTTVNVAAGKTVTITGTTMPSSNGSFELANWSQNNVLNIEGTLIANSGITTEGGNACPVVNIKNGGTLTMNAGLAAVRRENNPGVTGFTTINVESGATLNMGGTAALADTTLITVNVKDGATLGGAYGSGSTAIINKNFVVANDATVTLQTSAEKALTLNGTFGTATTSLILQGGGQATLGEATSALKSVNIKENTALTLDGATTISNGLTIGSGASIVTNGTLTLAGTASYTGTTQTRGETPTDSNGFGATITYANAFSGEGTVNSTATWTLNGTAATLNGKELSYSTATNVYYINTNAAITNITADHIGNADGNISSNVTLTGNASTVGMKLTGTQTGATYTFSGSITGAGNLVIEPTNPAAEKLADTYVFSGDISGWKGTGSGSFIATSNTALTFTGNATEINVNTIASGGHISTTYNHGKEVAVNGEVMNDKWTKGTINLTVTNNTTVDFNGTVHADALTVNSGSTANFTKAGSNVKAIAGEGTVTVGENADLTVSSASTIKQLGGLGTVKALDDLTVTEGNVSLGGLEIAGDKTVMLGTEESHNNTITLNNLTVTGSGSTINANLAVSGGTMTMSSSLEMGCSVTLGLDSKGHVSKEALTLPNASSEGPLAITILFTGVDSLTLGALGEVSEGWYDASEVFSTLTIGEGSAVTINPNEYVIGYWGTTVSIADKSVPEPATATLSLLALAALAARRRRH